MHNQINSNNPNNPLQFEVRRVQQQTDGRSLSVVIPNRFSKRMGLTKGDLLKSYLENVGNKLVFEKTLTKNHINAAYGLHSTESIMIVVIIAAVKSTLTINKKPMQVNGSLSIKKRGSHIRVSGEID